MPKKKKNPHVITVGRSYKKDNFLIKFFSSQKFLVIVGLIFLVLILFPLAKTYSQKKAIEREIEDVKSQINDFESQNKEFEEMTKYLQSDQFLEEQARLNLNMKKPGEEVFVIKEKKERIKTSISEEKKEEESSFRKWWNYFFN